MKLLNKLLSFTWTYKLIHVITGAYHYIKDYNLISDTLYSNEFQLVIKKYLKINLSKDWIGRLYGVINPNLDIDGNLDFNNVIIEIDGNNTNNIEYVKMWVYKQMQLIAGLFKIEKLYDYISVGFEHVGPENQDNYLVVFDITSRQNFTYYLKRFLGQTILYTIIGLSIMFFIV